MTSPAAPFDLRRDLVALLPRLRRFALTFAQSTEEADELVRSACLHAIGKGRCEEAEGRLDMWLFRLLGSQPRTQSGNGPVATVASSLASRACPAVHEVLVMDMPAGLASAFLLVEVEGLSYAEAAGILDVSTADLAARLCEARLHFADMHAPVIERRA